MDDSNLILVDPEICINMLFYAGFVFQLLEGIDLFDLF